MNANHKSIWSCDIEPFIKIRKGTPALLSYVWGYVEDGLTDAKDIKVEAADWMSLAELLCQLEEKALEYIKSQGGNDIRQYYIEDVLFTGDGIEFVYGT